MLCPDAAKDIVQDVFMDYYRKMQNGRAIASPGSYLYRSTLNKCIDEQRKNRKFAGNPVPEGIQHSHQASEQADTRQCIKHCLAALGAKDRELIVLYSEGLSYKEMAAVTRIPFASIGKTLSRALKKLEKELKTNGYELL